jgi:hypothetical protein
VREPREQFSISPKKSVQCCGESLNGGGSKIIIIIIVIDGATCLVRMPHSGWLVGISESGFVNGYATHLQVVRPVDRGGRLGAVLHYTG